MILSENRRPLFGIMLCTATGPLFVGAYESTVAVPCCSPTSRSHVAVPRRAPTSRSHVGHIVISSTTIPVDGRTNITLSFPFTYFNPCSPSIAARLSGSGRISDAPPLSWAKFESVGDLWKQVFGPKKQDRAGQSCYPGPSDAGSFGQREPGCGGGTARHDASRAVLNFSGLICLSCRCRQRINHPNV